jgi:hypothetical protein
MTIDITRFFTEVDPCDLCASIAEKGENAGRETWAASKAAAKDYAILTTDEALEAFRGWILEFGAWNADEIASWGTAECNALALQYLAGSIREAKLDDVEDDAQWEAYRVESEAGRCNSDIFRSGGKVYFSMTH